MASFLDFDIKDLFSRNKKDGSPGTKESTPIDGTVIKRIIIVLILGLVVFGSYFVFLKPLIKKQENTINMMNRWEQQVVSCQKEIDKLKNNIENLRNASSLKSGLFVSSDEFENFYAELTEATVNNGLKILNITRGEEIPVRVQKEQLDNSTYKYEPADVNISCEMNALVQAPTSNSIIQITDESCTGENCGPISYYKMTVTYQIEGLFGNYVQFRNVLANKAKIVNIESETISKHKDKNGRITAVATVSLVKNIK